MKIIHNIPTYHISWIKRTYNPETSSGIINNYYIPENKEELTGIIFKLNEEQKEYKIIGHTSNIYIQPNTNICNVISTRKICEYTEDDKYIYCDCGVSVKRLTKEMINKGIEGFAGLIDLPGTVGAAIYGNSSVGEYSIVKILEEVTVLDGNEIKTIHKKNLSFSFRNSCFSTNNQVILSCKLKKTYGNIENILKESKFYHEWRTKNQPGPENNLGTTVLIKDLKIKGFFIKSLAYINYQINKPIDPEKYKINYVLRLLNIDPKLSDYMFGYNRFIWNDYESHKYFILYKSMINQLYKNPKYEIQIW